MLTHAFGRGVHQLTGNRVAFLRHGTAGTPSLDERFVHFAQLAGHHHHDVQCDFAQGTGDQSQEVQGFGQAITSDMPRGLRHAQAQFGHQRFLDFQAFVTQ
ncbi:hypothetical protein D9M71_685230 [compost metagenome]